MTPKYGKSPTERRPHQGMSDSRDWPQAAGTLAGEVPGPVPCGGESPCDRRICGGGTTQGKGRPADVGRTMAGSAPHSAAGL